MEQESIFKFISGKAGVGKTFSIKNRVENDPGFAILCASTGIAAVNLNTTTIHSLLGYYNTETLKDNYLDGKVLKRIKKIARNYRYIALDELSMLPGEQLDIIVTAIEQYNDSLDGGEELNKLGLILIGDFGQLAPVSNKKNPASWAFEAQVWNDRFQPNIEFLTKVWRQNDNGFIHALDLAREGKGRELSSYLQSLGVEFCKVADSSFSGTTIYSKNDQVDSYNNYRLLKVTGPEIITYKEVKGKGLGEWDKIPDRLRVKVGAYVMILVNKALKYDEGIATEFEYCNGDCGTIVDYIEDKFLIRLARNGNIVTIPKLVRYNETKTKPEESIFDFDNKDELVIDISSKYEPWWSEERKRWILGEVEYHPLRLAYASTVHKVQGLSLDNVQIDIKDHFFGFPNMMYVSLSRARTLEGLRIVGNERLIEKRCNIDPKVEKWFRSLRNVSQ